MKACRIHRFGPPDVVSVEDAAVPIVGENELLVRVEAAGVGPWDGWVRAGKSVLDQPLPLTLGADLSGVVIELGRGVTGFAVGQEVFGVTNERFTGAHAELASVQASRMAQKPACLSLVDAASVPVVAVTALQMLFDHAQTAANQRVLIHGARGNVGAYAVQLARRAGAVVIATDVGSNVEVATALGADQVVDMRVENLESAVEPVDVVIDTVGGEVQRRSFAVMKRGGALVSSVHRPDASEAAAAGVRAAFMLVDVTASALSHLAVLFEAGAIAARVGAVLPLSRARDAHEMLEGTRARPPGRIVLTAR